MQVANIRIALLATLLTVGCDPAAKKGEEHDAPVAVEPTPMQQLTLLQGELRVAIAMSAAATEALRKAEGEGSEHATKPPADLATESTKRFSVFFGANNFGERNDCGCRKNPLGGLGRRHEMMTALTDGAKAPEIWGSAGPASGPVFHVDAGDSFYKSDTEDQQHAESQKVAKYDARSVVEALSTYAPDAYGLGLKDFVFGLDDVKQLQKKAKFPFLSANIATASGERPFEPSVVVERDGIRVAFVAVTNPKARRDDFWSARKLTAEPPSGPASDALAALPADVDAVVLLSNLGLADTGVLIGELKGAGMRVDLAVVSGTKRMTAEPEFAHGVPMLEPLSRGKYVGRADLWLNGTETSYRNARMTTPAALRHYRRALRSYWTTRQNLLKTQIQLAELALVDKTAERAQGVDAGAAAKTLVKRNQAEKEVIVKREETLHRRRENTSEALMFTIAKATEDGDGPKGDDWVFGTVIPVKIELEPEPRTRKVLDAREKRRPGGDGEVHKPVKPRLSQ